MSRVPAQRREGAAIERDLAALLGREAVLSGDTAAYLSDETEGRGLRGRADAIVLPGDAAQAGAAVGWCYERGVPIVPRGGGSGFAGGAVPLGGGVVLCLERMTRVRSFEPQLWRINVEAGLPTAHLRRLARESGLYFPPDPGAAEQSQIGGNIATNAGGPHAFKYGVTGAWVTGLEAVLAPGEVVSVGGPIRKDVAGYDLRGLLVGSEGTLGVITAAWLRLVPAPEAELPVAAFYGSAAAGCQAIRAVLANGLGVAALEFLDAGSIEAAGGSYPGSVPPGAGFMVVSEADGSAAEAERLRKEVVDVLGHQALRVDTPAGRADVAALWRWRDGVSIAVTAARGAKVSEDIVVPLDRLEEAVEETMAIGRRVGLPACSWGHAGDGNLHSTFMIAPGDEAELERAGRAAEALFDLAGRLGGSVSGEHGIGWVKRGRLAGQLPGRALAAHAAIKDAFDPKGLLNPGKKSPGPGWPGGALPA